MEREEEKIQEPRGQELPWATTTTAVAAFAVTILLSIDQWVICAIDSSLPVH